MSPFLLLITTSHIFCISDILHFSLSWYCPHSLCYFSEIPSRFSFSWGPSTFILRKRKPSGTSHFPLPNLHSAQRCGYISREERKRCRDVEPKQRFWDTAQGGSFLFQALCSKEPCQQHNIQTPLTTLPVRFVCSEIGNACLGSGKRLKKAEDVWRKESIFHNEMPETLINQAEGKEEERVQWEMPFAGLNSMSSSVTSFLTDLGRATSWPLLCGWLGATGQPGALVQL